MGKMAWGCGRLSVWVFLGFFKSYCFKEKIPFVCLALWNVGMLRLRLEGSTVALRVFVLNLRCLILTLSERTKWSTEESLTNKGESPSKACSKYQLAVGQ